MKPSRSHHLPRWMFGLSCAASVTMILALTTRHWPAQAAPTKAAPAPRKKLDPQAQRVTAALKRVLQSKVSSPGGKMELTVRPTDRAAQGYFSEIYIAAHPATIKQKLRISGLVMRARDVRLDVPHLLREGKVRTLSSNTTLRAVITENDLTQLLAKGKHSRAMGLRVKYLGDRMRVTGNWKWGWFNGPIIGVGKLRLAPDYKIHLDILSLKLNGAEVPQFVKDKFSEKINPVIDYEDMPFRPRFRGVKVEGTKATVSA